jgi:catechol 2,3-dioxygenase-like lactoylglutathione lyase family enzyme
MLDRLDHVIVAVADLETATPTLARLLGRRPTWRGEHPALGTENTLFRLDNTYIELLAPAAGSGGWLRERIEASGEGLLGLAFGTPDAGALAAAWSERGLHPQPPAEGMGRDVESGAFREWTNVHLPPSDTRGVLIFGIEQRSPDELLAKSPPLADAAATANAVDHVVVMTDAPEEAKALYGDRLGLRLALDRSFPKWGARLMFFRVGGLTVEVGARLEPEGEPRAEDDLWGITYRVADLDAAVMRLRAQEFDVSDVRAGRKEGTRVCSVRGPSLGIPTLLLEPPRPREP